MEQDSANLLANYLAGHDNAAREIVDRYTHRLIALAKTCLSAKIQQRVDPEDIVQSVYRSFFLKADREELMLERNGDLWRLLAGMTVNKARGRVEHELAKKRNPDSEESFSQVVDALKDEPTPEDATILIDLLTSFMEKLRDRDRTILEHRLQGQSIETIALEVELSEATVRRVLQRCRENLQRLLTSE